MIGCSFPYRPIGWLDPRLTVRPSPIAGRGLFARERIPAGAVVAIWGGRPVTDAEFAAAIAGRATYNAAAVGEDRNLLMADNDPVTFGNHACDPNLWMGDAVTVLARREIAVDEEATIDYAIHTVAEGWRMACRCGSSLCRHVISGSDWRLPILQRRYRGHFSPFINDRIAWQASDGDGAR